MIYRLDSRFITALFLLCTGIQPVYGQGISSIRVLDSMSTPFESTDDGLMFEVTTTSCGNLSVYIRSHAGDARLVEYVREFKGPSFFSISRNRLQKYCDRTPADTIKCELVASHVTCKTKEHTQKSVEFWLEINSPVGCYRLPEPPKPGQLPTDVTIRKKRPAAQLGILGGIALVVLGVLHEQKNKDNSAEKRRAAGAMASGVILVSLCSASLYKEVPDANANERNKLRNDYANEKWTRDLSLVRRRNAEFLRSFTIKVLGFD